MVSLKMQHRNSGLREDNWWKAEARAFPATPGTDAEVNLVSVRNSQRAVWLGRVNGEGKMLIRCR